MHDPDATKALAERLDALCENVFSADQTRWELCKDAAAALRSVPGLKETGRSFDEWCLSTGRDRGDSALRAAWIQGNLASPATDRGDEPCASEPLLDDAPVVTADDAAGVVDGWVKWYSEKFWRPIPEAEKAKDGVAADLLREMLPRVAASIRERAAQTRVDQKNTFTHPCERGVHPEGNCNCENDFYRTPAAPSPDEREALDREAIAKEIMSATSACWTNCCVAADAIIARLRVVPDEYEIDTIFAALICARTGDEWTARFRALAPKYDLSEKRAALRAGNDGRGSDESMKALSIQQPWAYCITHGTKRVENRTWYGRHTGPLLIHAGKKYQTGMEIDIHRDSPEVDVAGMLAAPRGALVGVCRMIRCLPPERFDLVPSDQRIWTDTDAFRFMLADVLPFAAPIPWKGALGFFEVENDAVQDAIRLARMGDGRGSELREREL